MKQLVSPGRVEISSTLARGGAVNNRPHRAPCFVSLWRDCTNHDAYLLFSDGSLYHYFNEAASVAVALTDALVHGKTFNFVYRRALFSLPSYAKITGPVPSTATLIYHYPPYPGTDPGPCPACTYGVVWSLLHGCYKPTSSDFLEYDGTSSTNSGQVVIEGPVIGAKQITFNWAPAQNTGHGYFFGPFGSITGSVTRNGVNQPIVFFPAGTGFFQVQALVPLAVCTPDVWDWTVTTFNGHAPPLNAGVPVQIM